MAQAGMADTLSFECICARYERFFCWEFRREVPTFHSTGIGD